jgi:hypothetical protein
MGGFGLLMWTGKCAFYLLRRSWEEHSILEEGMMMSEYEAYFSVDCTEERVKSALLWKMTTLFLFWITDSSKLSCCS